MKQQEYNRLLEQCN
jgi:hypothetical protein